MSKSKGSNAERDLIRRFWAAGSGSMHFPSPDILAGNKIRRLAVEVKITKEDKKYFPKEEIKQLINFSSYFGAEAWVAVKFPGAEWMFANPEDLDDTGSNYILKKESHKGLSFSEVTGNLP